MIENQYDVKIKIVKIDYDFELRNINFDTFLINKNILFEFVSIDAQDVNEISKAHQRIITIMIQTTILDDDIFDFLWSNVTLIMTYIKNRRFSFFLNDMNFVEKLIDVASNLSNLHSLEIIAYVVKNSKHKNHFEFRDDKDILIEYDDDIIYRVWISLSDDNEIRKIKNVNFYDVATLKQYIVFNEIIAFEQKRCFIISNTISDVVVSKIIASKNKSITARKDKFASEISHDIFSIISHKFIIMRSNRQVKTIDFFMNSFVYSTISNNSTKIFNVVMIELLSNWKHFFNDLVVFLNCIEENSIFVERFFEWYNDSCVVNSISLLIDFIESQKTINFEDFVVLNNMNNDESNTWAQIINSSNSSNWMNVVEDEFQSLDKNKTWTLINRTFNDRKFLDDKWIFKIKRNVEENIARYKIRWIVKNYLQQYDIDFEQIFVFVIKSMIFRILFVIVVFLDLEIEQMNVKTVFLYDLIDTEVYVRYFENYNEKRICKFRKALYDFKQFSRLWYERLIDFLLEKLNLHHLHVDHNIFATTKSFKNLIFTFWIDDIKVIVLFIVIINKIKKELFVVFEMIDIKSINFYLNMIVIRNRIRKKFRLNQKIYIKRIVIRFDRNEVKSIHISMRANFAFVLNENQIIEVDTKLYQIKMNFVMFAMIEIKSDVFNVISIVSRFAQNSSKTHMSVANDILDYFNIFDRLNIVYEKEDLTSQSYCDVNYDENLITRKFIDVYVFILNKESMSWMSKFQSIVIISTCVAKHIVISAVTRETIWLRSLFVDLYCYDNIFIWL